MLSPMEFTKAFSSARAGFVVEIMMVALSKYLAIELKVYCFCLFLRGLYDATFCSCSLDLRLSNAVSLAHGSHSEVK